MPALIAFDWNRDDLEILEAEVANARVTVRRAVRVPWPEAIDREQDAVNLGRWLREQLTLAGVEAEQAIAVLPREEVVTRRLEVPQCPDEELPELVRFQAATRSATPLDQLVLDFVPLPFVNTEAGRPVLMATIEAQDLKHVQNVCQAAGLELISLQASPFAVAELAVRLERQRGDDPQGITLVVFQDRTRVELSILQQLGLVFTHQTRIEADDDRSVRSTLAEINRSVVTLGQMMHTTIEVERVCLIHDGDVAPRFEQALAERFGGKLLVIDPATAAEVAVQDPSLSGKLAGMAPAVGALLARLHSSVPAIDFLAPRKPPVKKDLQRERLIKFGGAAAAAIVLLGGSAWLYSSQLDGQIAGLRIQDRELTETLQNAKGPLDAHARIQAWNERALRPLDEIDQLNQLLPGTKRLVMLDLQVLPPVRGEPTARITGTGIAREDRDINELFDTLAVNGYRVQPKVSELNKLDPDYPRKFVLDITRLPEAPSEKSSAGNPG